MADKSYVVVGAAALVYNADRSAATTVSRNGAVPADSDNLQHLLDIGLVEEGEAVGGVDSDADAAPPFPLPDEAQPKSSKAKSAD